MDAVSPYCCIMMMCDEFCNECSKRRSIEFINTKLQHSTIIPIGGSSGSGSGSGKRIPGREQRSFQGLCTPYPLEQLPLLQFQLLWRSLLNKIGQVAVLVGTHCPTGMRCVERVQDASFGAI